jgi:hypothetical protein
MSHHGCDRTCREPWCMRCAKHVRVTRCVCPSGCHVFSMGCECPRSLQTQRERMDLRTKLCASCTHRGCSPLVAACTVTT